MKRMSRTVLGLVVLMILLTGCARKLQVPEELPEEPPAEVHRWNGGELTRPITAQSAVEITYTCMDCGAVRHEEAAADSPITTRADLEAAVAELAWDYYFKKEKLQYCSEELGLVGKFYGGRYRVTEGASPEYGTAHTTINSVCSDYIWKVYYEALEYPLFGMEPLDAVTAAMWLFSKNQPEGADIRALTESDTDIALIRWAKADYAWETEWGFSAADGAAEAEMDAFLADWEKNLRPGDAIENNGHVMLYVGNGMVLHCGGLKYDPETGVERREANGGIRIMSAAEYGDPEAGYYYRKHDRMVIFRPSYLLAPAGCDGDPGNDIVALALPAKTRSRLQYPAMEIDRTVDITPYGTAAAGETLTYTVRISNCSHDPEYRRWRGQAYAPEAYTDLVVTETVPAGTELVEHSINSGGHYDASAGKITWRLSVAAGSTAQLSYQVRVTAPIGSVITSSGGFAAQIPSNTICNPVGGAKLSDHAQAMAVLGGIQPNEDGGESGIDFVNGLYRNMGFALELPPVSDLVDNLFQQDSAAREAVSIRYDDAPAVQVFTLRETLPDGYRRIRDMMIPGFWGGYRFYTGAEARGTTVYELQEAYLAPGDILVWVAVNNGGAVTGHRVLLYTADAQLVSVTPEGIRKVYSGKDVERVLWQTLRRSNALFFALRPSQINGQ